jgi:hypothetical protein
MDSQQPKRSSSAFEYFLYAAMVAETGLAAVIYKVIFGSSEMVAFRVYFAIFYFAFLAWTIAQLTMLHRDRALKPEIPEPEAEPAPEPSEDTRPALGLTGSQLMILVVVFAIAVATFSWALRVLR